MSWPHLISALSRCDEPQAFIYCAEIGTAIESSAFGLNPSLPFEYAARVLAPPPMWLGTRRDLLSEPWPQTPPRSETDLVARALASCKAMLALGAVIPDGALEQMQRQFHELFPALAQARGNTSQFRGCKFRMGIRASGSHETWFEYWCGREGPELPIDDSHLPSASCGNWTNWEVAMKNLVRLDLQFHLERSSRQS